MKKFVFLLLVIVLTACGSPSVPTEQPVAQEPVVVTVVVEPTQAPPEPAVPTAAEPVVVTVVVQPTEAAAPPTAAPSGDEVISLENALGRGVFTDMTMSSNNVTLRCFPRDITFNVTTPNNNIVDVLFYYRMVDADRLYPSEWKNFGPMTSNGGGNYTLAFKGEDVNSDIRIDGGWLDFQFVGLAKSGDVVDRSDKIESRVTYTFDCP